MTIDLTSDHLKEIVQEAILRSLDSEKREALIQGALRYLIEPPKGDYYGGRQPSSPLQSAFQDAVGNCAITVATELFSTSHEIQEKIKTLLHEAMILLFEKNRHQTVLSIASAIATGMANSRE